MQFDTGRVDSITRTYNSFSGSDIKATCGGVEIAEIQGVSFTIQREKAPIYVMGRADPLSFSRGKRGIAGSLVFKVLDRSSLINALRDTEYGVYLEWKDNLATQENLIPNLATNSIITAVAGLSRPTFGSGVALTRVQIDKVMARPQYNDQVRPFDIVLTAANEYGGFMQMQIRHVEIINMGSSVSVDDMQIDEACTYIAREIIPWGRGGYVRVDPSGNSAERRSDPGV